MKKFDFDHSLTPKILEYLPEFLARRFQDISDLDNYIQNKKYDEVRAICHRIYGVAAPYGMAELGQLAKSLGDKAKTSDQRACRAVLEQMFGYLKEAEIHLKQS